MSHLFLVFFSSRPSIDNCIFFTRSIVDVTTNKCLSIRYPVLYLPTYLHSHAEESCTFKFASKVVCYAKRSSKQIRVVGRSIERGRVRKEKHEWKDKKARGREGGREREGRGRRVRSSFRRDENKEQFIFGGHMCWLFQQFAQPS